VKPEWVLEAERAYEEWKQRVTEAAKKGVLSEERMPYKVRLAALRKLKGEDAD
jgi:hypothetical protein